MSLRTVVVGAAGLAPFTAGLRRLEAGIQYPIEDGARHFTIDHGPDYHPFFGRMGEASFLVALDGGEVVGSLACALKPAAAGGRRLRAAYLADLKIAPRLRGRGVGRALVTRALGPGLLRPRLLDWDVAFGAAMRGARGDVMRAMAGPSPAAAARVLARLAVYFAPREALLALAPGDAPASPRAEDALDLSPARVELAETTRGAKDLRLVGGGDFALVHLPAGPSAWAPSHGAYLARAARAWPRGEEGALACFALDERLVREIGWLRRAGVAPGATCTVWGMFHPLRRRPRSDYVHLATSEI